MIKLENSLQDNKAIQTSGFPESRLVRGAPPPHAAWPTPQPFHWSGKLSSASQQMRPWFVQREVKPA